MSAHDFNYEAALMTSSGARDGINGVDDPVQSRISSDRHVGANHIVVDGSDQTGDHERRIPLCGLIVNFAILAQFLYQSWPFLAKLIRAG